MVVVVCVSIDFVCVCSLRCLVSILSPSYPLTRIWPLRAVLLLCGAEFGEGCAVAGAEVNLSSAGACEGGHTHTGCSICRATLPTCSSMASSCYPPATLFFFPISFCFCVCVCVYVCVCGCHSFRFCSIGLCALPALVCLRMYTSLSCFLYCKTDSIRCGVLAGSR